MFNDGRVWLGHKRLSILDLSTNGSQPMERDQQVWLTYNGEIYNYKEIRSELELNGYSFTSQTDTKSSLRPIRNGERLVWSALTGCGRSP